MLCMSSLSCTGAFDKFALSSVSLNSIQCDLHPSPSQLMGTMPPQVVG